MSAVHAVSDATPSHQIPIRIVFGVEKIIAWTQREHTPFALVERSLVRQKIPEALGAICLCGARENLTESIGKRVHLARPRTFEDQFDPDGVNFLLRDLQSGWLRRFDEAK